MTATTTHPHDALGSPVKTLTFPISIDYVKGWTLVRAISEAVANAIDADPTGFCVAYDGASEELVITDHAADGVGVESMVFGWSDKTGRDDVIGQFGEGLKIATIRAVSDPAVRHMVIESVGVTIVPTITDHSAIDGLTIPVKSAAAPKVLAWNLHHSTRPRGTRIRVGVPKATANAVMDRFRHITDSEYAPPADPGVIVPAQPGRIWIGGVLVQENPKLLFGYDLSLGTAKSFQNRDRTVVDTYRLRHYIAQLHRETTNPAILAALIRGALEGRLVELETSFTSFRKETAAQRRLWSEATRLALGDPNDYFYLPNGANPEVALNLADENLRQLHPNGLRRFDFEHLMHLLGVQRAKERADKPPSTIDWVTRLDDSEQERLDDAVTMMRRLLGPKIIDTVRVYHSVAHEHGTTCQWNGFYEPSTKLIALHRDVLADRATLWETLFHEAGHRAAHLGIFGNPGHEHADRTRGFESTLGSMAVALLRQISEHTSVLTSDIAPAVPPVPFGPTSAPYPDPPAGFRTVFTSAKQPPVYELSAAPEAREALMSQLLRWGDQHGIAERRLFTTYAKEHSVTAAQVRGLLTRPVSRKMSFQRVADVVEPLGINAGAVWWVLVAPLAMLHRRAPHDLRVRTPALPEINAACSAVAAGREAHLAEALRRMSERAAAPFWHDASWLDPIISLTEPFSFTDGHVDRARELSFVPGGPTVQAAWEAHLTQ